MVTIPNFEVILKGKTYTDSTELLGKQLTYEVIGYGESPGNPYFVGLVKLPDGHFMIRTTLMKNAVLNP